MLPLPTFENAIDPTFPGARPALEDLAEALKKRYPRRRVMVELLKPFKLFLAGKST